MHWNSWFRRVHRWLSVVFTAAVIANLLALTLGRGRQPSAWITYAPLPPLALMWFTGMYLLALPYANRWRGGRRADASA